MRAAISWTMAWCILLGAGAQALAASGQDVPLHSLAVVLLPGSEGNLDTRLGLQNLLLSQALAQSGNGFAWKLIGTSLLVPPTSEGDLLADIAKKVDAGKKAYRYLKLPQAEETFREAAGQLRANPPAKCDRKMVTELYLYWARAALDAGDEKVPGPLLAEIARFDPNAGPDPATMPPNLVATWDVAQEERKAKAAGKIQLDVGPGAGTLYVDCEQKAAGLVEVSGPVGGEFLLVGAVDGGTFRSRLVFPEGPARLLKVWSGQPGDMARISERFAALQKDPVSVISIPPAGLKDLDQMAGIFKAEFLLLGEVRATGEGKDLRLAIYIPGKGVQGKPVDVPFGADGLPSAAAIDAAFDGLAKTAKTPSALMSVATQDKQKVAPTSGAENAGEKKKEDEGGATPWYKTWWFWTAVGVVAVGAVVAGTVIGVESSSSSPSGKVILTINPP